MNEEPVWKTVGKKVLTDAVELAKDTGAFIFELTKHIVNMIRSASKNENGSDNDIKCVTEQ